MRRGPLGSGLPSPFFVLGFTPILPATTPPQCSEFMELAFFLVTLQDLRVPPPPQSTPSSPGATRAPYWLPLGSGGPGVGIRVAESGPDRSL